MATWSCLVLIQIATHALSVWDSMQGWTLKTFSKTWALSETGEGLQRHHVLEGLSVLSFAICSAWLMVTAYTQCLGGESKREYNG